MQQSRRDLIERVRSKHPHRRSLCGALLAEILSDAELSERNQAAFELGQRECRRGIGALENLVSELRRTVESVHDEWVGPPESQLLYSVLFAVAKRSTPRSHALLARLLLESRSHLVRADVLEAMAFEDERFDFDLVPPFASDRSHPAEILSALYALECRDYANKRPEEARTLVTPLLAHPHSMVRVYGIGVLKSRASNLDLILPLAKSSNEHVRKAVVEAIAFIETSAEG